MIINKACKLVLPVFLILAGFVFGEEATWPAFNGANHDNISPDKGLLKEWPAEGPKLLWKFDNCGNGYSSATVADGKVFIAGDIKKDTIISALDLKGNLLWQQKNGSASTMQWGGSRGSVVYSDGMVYQINGNGRLGAFNANDGKEVWFVSLTGEELKGKAGR